MSRRQRWTLGAVAGLVGVVALAALVAGGSSRDGRDQRLSVEAGTAETTTTEAPPSTDTTVALVPVTTGVPVPTTPTTSSAASGNVRVSAAPAASPPAAAPAGPPAIGADGAVLAPPNPPPATRAIDKAKGCRSAVDPGWKIVDCGALRTSGTVLVWLVESRGKGLRALVLKEQAPGQWATVLRAADDDGSRFSSIGVRGEDASGDGQPELGFGFHRRGPDRVLALDLVDASGAVGLHRELPQGSVTLSKGELVTWAATGDGRAQRSLIRHAGGAWRIVASEAVDRTAVPPSMV